MKKAKGKPQVRERDKDTMRPEYDFSKAFGGHGRGLSRRTNIIVLDPDLMDVFPDSKAVNEACERWRLFFVDEETRLVVLRRGA